MIDFILIKDYAEVTQYIDYPALTLNPSTRE